MFQALFPGVMMQSPMDMLLAMQQRQFQQTQWQMLRQQQAPQQMPQSITTSSTTTYTDTDETYVFTQSVPSASWTINHNLGEFPSVTVVDGTGKVVIADVQYINSNQIVVSFANPFAGKAYLNV